MTSTPVKADIECDIMSHYMWCATGVLVSIPICIRRKSYLPLAVFAVAGTTFDLYRYSFSYKRFDGLHTMTPRTSFALSALCLHLHQIYYTVVMLSVTSNEKQPKPSDNNKYLYCHDISRHSIYNNFLA